MTISLASKPGLTGATALSIPKDWNPTWFRNFINNMLKGADVRNAEGVNGIVVSGTIASPYATIGFGAPVTIPGAASGASLTIAGASPLSLPNVTVTTTSPVAGGAGALPATPAGYMAITIAGVARRIPFYT
jgi:hypothetical protein